MASQRMTRLLCASHPRGGETALEQMVDAADRHEAQAGEEVVVYRREDGRIGLIFPSGSALADEGDLLIAEPRRYRAPLTLDAVRRDGPAGPSR